MSDYQENPTVEIEQSVNDFNSTQLMAMALIRTGLSNKQICKQAQITPHQYNMIKDRYDAGNFDKLSTEVIENWGNVICAKLMQVTEKALDKTMEYMDADLIKEAKIASGIVTENFGTFRLSTGKSTENIETTSIRLTQMIESRTGLQKPNQSQYHDNAPDVNTSPPQIEIIA